jgi:hypothetical protein
MKRARLLMATLQLDSTVTMTKSAMELSLNQDHRKEYSCAGRGI